MHFDIWLSSERSSSICARSMTIDELHGLCFSRNGAYDTHSSFVAVSMDARSRLTGLLSQHQTAVTIIKEIIRSASGVLRACGSVLREAPQRLPLLKPFPRGSPCPACFLT